MFYLEHSPHASHFCFLSNSFAFTTHSLSPLQHTNIASPLCHHRSLERMLLPSILLTHTVTWPCLGSAMGIMGHNMTMRRSPKLPLSLKLEPSRCIIYRDAMTKNVPDWRAEARGRHVADGQSTTPNGSVVAAMRRLQWWRVRTRIKWRWITGKVSASPCSSLEDSG